MCDTESGGKDPLIWAIRPSTDGTGPRASPGGGSDITGETVAGKGSQPLPCRLHPHPLGVGMPREGMNHCWLSKWDAARRVPPGSPRARSLTSGDFVNVDIKTQHGRAQHEGHSWPDGGHGEQDPCGGARAERVSALREGTRGDRRCLEAGPRWTRIHPICLQHGLFPWQLSYLMPFKG